MTERIARLLLLGIACLVVFARPPPAVGEDADPSRGRARLLRIDGAELPWPSRETCRLDPTHDGLPEGLADGDQLRVARADGSEFALFTVKLERGDPDDVDAIGLATEGLARLGERDDSASGEVLELRLPAARAELTEDAARREGELVEVVREPEGRGRWLLVLAPHGGLIERGTDTIAGIVARSDLSRPVSLWMLKGYREGGSAFSRWHITSTALSNRSFPGLARVARQRYEHALSIHGHSGDGILVGGGGPREIRVAVRDAIAGLDLGYEVELLTRGHRFGGMATTNIVNRYSANGVQIEFPVKARTLDAERMATAVATVYRSLAAAGADD